MAAGGVTGRRGWAVASALTFGAPVAALVLVGALTRLRWESDAVALGVVAITAALTVLGLHLLPLSWWARGLIACVYLPLLAASWVMAALVTVCLVASECL